MRVLSVGGVRHQFGGCRCCAGRVGGFPDKSDIKVRGAVRRHDSAKLAYPCLVDSGLPLPGLVLAESCGLADTGRTQSGGVERGRKAQTRKLRSWV